MIGLYVSLACLGLAAIDPVGIGIVCLLLAQERPYARTFIFLSGSFISLVVMGLVFALGLGAIVLRFEDRYPWIVSAGEAIAGLILLLIAIAIYVQLRRGKFSIDPPKRARVWLRLGYWHLFFLGVLLVAIQSVLDVVFVVAMIHIGQFRLSGLALIVAIVTYSFSALILQLAVVTAFRFAPLRQKTKTLQVAHGLLAAYSNQALAVVSFGLGCLLLILAASQKPF